MKIKKMYFCFPALVFLFAASIAYCGVPQLINYQGKLTDKNGATVADSSYNAEFRVYDLPTGGTMLWSETTLVNTSKGIFNVILGDQNPFPAAFFYDNPTIYLAVKIGTDAEMSPRQRITSVGFALSAADKPTTTSTSSTAVTTSTTTTSISGGGSNVPTGVIVMWSGAADQIPSGWALCDGQNGTPDLRDRFIVGAGSSYGVGATGGEAAHTLTVDEMPIHNHGVTDPGHKHDYYYYYDTVGSGYPGGGDSNVMSAKDTSNSATNITIQNAGNGQPHNSLPPYYAVAFIMKL